METECTDDRNSVALCNLIRHDVALAREYQNFDTITHVPNGEEEFYGGSVSLADHCPYIQEFIWKNKSVAIRGSQCQFEDNNPSELIFKYSIKYIFILIIIILIFFFFFHIKNQRKILPSNHMVKIQNVLHIQKKCGKNVHVVRLENGDIGVLVVININVKVENYQFW